MLNVMYTDDEMYTDIYTNDHQLYLDEGHHLASGCTGSSYYFCIWQYQVFEKYSMTCTEGTGQSWRNVNDKLAKRSKIEDFHQ